MPRLHTDHAKEPWQMTRQEFRQFVEAQSNASHTANPPLSIGDYNIPQTIIVNDRTYRFRYSSTGIRGRSMAMSNEIYLSGPGIPPNTKTTAHGSQENGDATFVLRHIRKAEIKLALAKNLPIPPFVLAKFHDLIP